MTAKVFFDNLTSIVEDLSRDIPAEARYHRLLQAMVRLFPCDAAALLRLDDEILVPLAIEGLSDDTMGRRFEIDQHPRLSWLLLSREPVRFPADSDLPDPYDGLLESGAALSHVHDCMGFSLYVDHRPWGVLTLDAMEPGTFDNIDPVELKTFISLTEATVKAAERIDQLTARAERQQQVTKALVEEGRSFEIIGRSEPIESLKREISIVAQSHLIVLVLGETGVGKELVARQVHHQSQRASHPLVYVNCAALPESIAESELFGHIKGAFTGAISDRAGKFEIADSGTLFLDEIGELPLSIQGILLRVLQNGEVQRVGSDKHIEVDVRVVAATNRDLKEEVTQGRFRADLYHRLSVYPVKVPPLRERGKDILLLSGFFLEANQKRFGVRTLRLSEPAKIQLRQYEWPGNVRELEHLLNRAALRAIAERGRDSLEVVLETHHLGLSDELSLHQTNNNEIQFSAPSTQVPVSLNPGVSMKSAVDQFQSELVNSILIRHSGNQAAAARELQMNRGNFSRLLKRLGLR